MNILWYLQKNEQEIKETKAKLDANIAELESEISANKEKSAKTIKQQTTEATNKIAELKEQKAKLEEEVATLNTELEGLLAQVPADCKAEADAFKTAQKDYTDLKSTKEKEGNYGLSRWKGRNRKERQKNQVRRIRDRNGDFGVALRFFRVRTAGRMEVLRRASEPF